MRMIICGFYVFIFGVATCRDVRIFINQNPWVGKIVVEIINVFFYVF